MFGFLCNPLFMTKQVKIHVHNLKYAPDEAEKESSILNQQVETNSRRKPSSLFFADEDAAFEAAFYEFTRELELKEESYEEFETNLLLSETAFLSYSLSSKFHVSSSASSYSGGPVMKLLSHPFSPFSPMSQTSLLDGLEGFLLLLQRWEAVPCDHFPRSVCSLEKLLFCTVTFPSYIILSHLYSLYVC